MNTFSHLTFVIFFGFKNFRCWNPVCIWTCFTLRWKPDILPMILLRHKGASGLTSSFMPASWYQWVEIKRFQGICMLLPTQTTGRQHSKEPASQPNEPAGQALKSEKKNRREAKWWYDMIQYDMIWMQWVGKLPELQLWKYGQLKLSFSEHPDTLLSLSLRK